VDFLSRVSVYSGLTVQAYRTHEWRGPVNLGGSLAKRLIIHSCTIVTSLHKKF
jgi:hypothetical protein